MRTRTKRLSVLLLSAGMVVSAACAAGVLFHGEGLIAHADNAKGMAVLTNAPRSTYWDETQMSIPITFKEGQSPQGNSLMSVDSFVKDYVVIDGVTASPNIDWYHMGNGPFNPAGRSDFALTFCSSNRSWIAEVKEVKLLAGFSWVVCDTEVHFPNEGTGYYKLNGAELQEDVVLWNGGENGWLPRATSITATLPDNVKVPRGGAFDTSVLTVTATLLDGTTQAVPSSACTVDLDASQIGEKEITVHYQDRTYKPANKVEVFEANGVTKIELNKESITTPQYEVPTLKDVTVTATYADNSTATIPIGNCTVTFADREQIWTQGASTTATVSYTLYGKTVSDTLTVNVGAPDLTTGLVPCAEERANAGTAYNATMLQFPFKSTDGRSLDVNIFRTELYHGNHILDYVEVTYNNETKSLRDWMGPMAVDTRVFNSGMFIINSDAHPEFIAGISKITFKKGFEWVTADADNWGISSDEDYINEHYYTVSNLVLKRDYSFHNRGKSGWEKAAARIEATYSGGPVAMGDRVDPAKITVTAYFSDGTQQNIPVTESMLSRTSFDQKGEQTLVVTYQDCTANITVQVTADTLKAIEIVKNPDILTYEVGEWDVVLKGIEVELVYETEAGTERKVTLANPEEVLEVVDWSPYTTEATSLTVSYQGKTASIPITMVPASRGGMRVAWERGGGFSSDKQSPNLSLTFEIQDVNASTLKAIKLHGNEDHVFDYIEINGKPASQWLGHGLDWIGFFQYELTLTFKGTALVWGTGSNAEDNHDPDSYYVEGVSEVVHTVKLLKGFTWYTSADGDDKWSNASENDVFVKVPHAILNEDVLLINEDGYGWTRMLKQDGGQAAEDAITVSSMPTQTTYAVGEAFNTDGFEIHLKYEDGGEETVGVVSSDIVRFNNRQEGKQTVTVNLYRNKAYAVTIEVTVGEQPAEKKGCRGDFSVSAAVLAAAAAGAALLVCRKRKGSDE